MQITTIIQTFLAFQLPTAAINKITKISFEKWIKIKSCHQTSQQFQLCRFIYKIKNNYLPNIDFYFIRQKIIYGNNPKSNIKSLKIRITIITLKQFSQS